eukprot:TRINITY_DN17121_c0_g1_i2.p1 TRINITY_DN17121_c0_g1~~TRINITY_DN17121_c0_g1_i2.p1  ORF type:complete len:224 (+),score=74.17 TRINITY_DN17121_c0_g1_i2:69-740(+)
MAQWSIAQALAAFEADENECRRKEAEDAGLPQPAPVHVGELQHVKLYAGGAGRLPPITKWDKEVFANLKCCRHLSLSSNAIGKIEPGLHTVPCLEVLSLGRNKIKKLENLDLPNLKQLWVSYNFIERLSGLERLRSLQVLYASNNLISSWSEVSKLEANSELSDLLLINNRLHTDIDKGTEETRREWRLQVLMRLPRLVKIDGEPVEHEERELATARGDQAMI